MKRKSLILAIVLGLFILTTNAFARTFGDAFGKNWIEYFHGDTFYAFVDSERIIKTGNTFDYYNRLFFTDPIVKREYLTEHVQVQLRNGVWWTRVIESWYLVLGDNRKFGEKTIPTEWTIMDWAEKPPGIVLLYYLQKYAKEEVEPK